MRITTRVMRPARTLVGMALGLSAFSPLPRPELNSGAPLPFAVAKVHFEQNETDGDVEVVFEVKGGAEGLTQLSIVSPDNRAVVAFTAPEASTLGMRQFRFESPEPRAVNALKAAYPEGVYTFVATSASGEKLQGRSTLSHKLPATTAFVYPAPEAENVPATELEITWGPVKNLSAYIIYIEQDELNVNLTAQLPSSIAKFAVPKGFLLPATEYQLGLGTVTSEGNTSFIETSFSTAQEK